jgi:cell wall assembly regulator SMI1
MNNSMQPVWSRLEAIFKQRYPTLFESLNPPATVEQLDAFEAATQLRLPDDVRESYLLHDGCKGTGELDEDEKPALFCRYRWSSLSESLARWQSFQEVVLHGHFDDTSYFYSEAEDPDGWAACEVRPWEVVFPPCWFPIGQLGSDLECGWFIDMLPGPKGSMGQLIYQIMGASSLVVTRSFSNYLHALADSLEKGEIEHSTDGSKWASWMWRYKDTKKGFLSPQFGW